MTRAATHALLALALAACGGDDAEEVPSNIEPYAVYAGRCESPRSGIDPSTGGKYIDVKGSQLDEKLWVRSWINDLYLWYREVPAADPRPFATPVDYFAIMKTGAFTKSGNAKDNFHFARDTSEWVALSQSGVEAGYGIQWVLLMASPPRKLLVGYADPNTPAAAAHIDRGASVLTIDGVDFVNGSNIDVLNQGIAPGPDESHTFVILDPGATAPRTVTLRSANIETTPVQNVKVLSTATGMVGYMQFNDHIATAEKGLVNAITMLRDARVTDLVLDMRYNGGGYLAIAAQLGYMIAGPDRTNGKTFERETFNDKYPTMDPVTGDPLTPSPFLDHTVGFSLPAGQPLPTLNLSRVFVLTGGGTCSASEAVMNGLAGVDVQVIQIGSKTCGKPYGFYPADNCGTTYFAIQFQGVNQKDFGDYADGFVPQAILPGCPVPDDFAHALGDQAEARLATALAYRANGSCTTTRIGPEVSPLEGEGTVLKSIWRQNRILTPERR